MLKISKVLISIFFIYIIGFASGIYKFPPYSTLIQIKTYLDTNSKNKSLESLQDLNECKIRIADKFIKQSSLFIGHAYGSPKKGFSSGFIAPDLEKFLQKNSSEAEMIIFTGDVFRVPYSHKWKKLREIIGKNTNIYVAPGNHDFDGSDSKKVFKNSEFGLVSYPQAITNQKSTIIIENSVDSNWGVAESTIAMANSNSMDHIIIARHHTPIKELLPFVNGNLEHKNLKNFSTVKDMVIKFNHTKLYTWIIGDGGAYEYLPRIACYEYMNHRFIVNGIGQTKGDSIIMYINNEFLEYKLPHLN